MTGPGAEAFADVQGRMKALAVAEPLLELDRAQPRLDRGWADYRMAELALAAIDAVALRMGIDDGADPDEVEGVVASFAAVQRPDRAESEHRAVAEWIIHRLVRPDDRDRAFSHDVGGVDDGDYQVRRISFQLLRDTQNSEGKAVLEASDEAINVLVHALDVDIASEQVAAEAKLRVLLKRGDISQARQAAMTASLHSQRFLKRVQARLDAARSDIKNVDWESDVAPVTEEALLHLRERIEEEHALMDLARTLQDRPLNDEQRRDLDELMNALAGCERTHLALSSLIGRVGDEIREQITRQAFAPPELRPSVHLASQLLKPVLELSVDEATGPLERFVQRVLVPVRPSAFYLPQVLMGLAEPPEDTDEADEVAVEPIGDEPPTEPPAVFTPDQEEAVRSAIESGARSGARLSAMLEHIRIVAADRDLPANTDQLLALRVLQLYAGPVEEGEQEVIGALRDGQRLEHVVFGGDDLVLTQFDLSDTTGVPIQRKAPEIHEMKEHT